MSLLELSLVSAYRETNYHVQTIKSFVMTVDLFSPELNYLLREYDATSAAFVTAHNPYGVKLSDGENRIRNLQLKADSIANYIATIDGYGESPQGLWPREDSFLICGITLDDSIALGKKYQQNAIIFAENDAIPKLILLR